MPEFPVVSSLWIGPKLSFLEQLCLKSFVDAGQTVKLYVYDDVEGVPDGVVVAPAKDIMPASEFIFNAALGAPGPHADKFRYHLLKKTDEIWADTDAYCVKPFPDTPYLFACHYKTLVANGVLRLPKDSGTLDDLLEFTASETPTLAEDFPFFDRAFKAEYEARSNKGEKMHISEMPWEVWGPYAISYFISRNNELKNAVPGEVLYPIQGGEILRTLRMPRRARITIPEESISIHFYGSKMRQLLRVRPGGVPHPKSFLGQLCIKHDIDPTLSPIY